MKTPLMIPRTRVSDPACQRWPEDDVSLDDAESLLEQLSPADGRRSHPIRDFLASHLPDYCKEHPLPEAVLKILNSMVSCKTGKLGYNLSRCDSCGRMEMHACACGNRNCPSCGYLNEQRWVAARQAEVIPGIPYFHLIFTLPHQLGGIMLQNQKETLSLLFRSVKDTILVLSQDKLGITPGILMVLHTFGSNLSLHYHLHVLVSGGGLTAGGQAFKRCLSRKFFLPVKALGRLYRGKFMDGLKQLKEEGRLSFCHDALKYRNSYEWKELLDSCYRPDWNVEIKYLSPVSSRQENTAEDENTNNAITYFSRYTNRTAISDSRIEGYDDHSIRFRYKAYSGASYTWETMELKADEFIRRFLMHILPPGFTRVRSAGFLAGCVRKKNLERIYELLGSTYQESPVKSMKAADLIQYFYHRDITVCEKCHGKLFTYPRMHKQALLCMIRAS